MVISFAKDYSKGADLSLIEQQVKAGDMTAVLLEYENDLKTPSK